MRHEDTMCLQFGPFRFKFFCRGERPRLLLHIGNWREQTMAPRPSPQYRGVLRNKEKYLMAKVTITDSQQVECKITYADRKGKPTPPPAGATTPKWMVDNTDLLTLDVSGDGMTCTVKAVDPLGTGKVSVKVTDGGDTTLLSGELDVEVVSGAPTIQIKAGEPIEQA
jgi:hypothetical protein